MLIIAGVRPLAMKVWWTGEHVYMYVCTYMGGTASMEGPPMPRALYKTPGIGAVRPLAMTITRVGDMKEEL